jgi:hypothetical protein
MLKKVARTPYASSMERMVAVLAPGPSSKVRATVFPPDGMVGA